MGTCGPFLCMCVTSRTDTHTISQLNKPHTILSYIHTHTHTHTHTHQTLTICLGLSSPRWHVHTLHTVCLNLMFLWKAIFPAALCWEFCTATVPFAFKWTSSNIEAASSLIWEPAVERQCEMLAFWGNPLFSLSCLSISSLLFAIHLPLSLFLSFCLSPDCISSFSSVILSLSLPSSPLCPFLPSLCALSGLHIDDVLPAGLARQAAVVLWDPSQPHLR